MDVNSPSDRRPLLSHSLLLLLQLVLEQKVRQQVDHQVQALHHIADDHMRQLRFAAWVAEWPDELLLEALQYLLDSTWRDRSPFRAVVSSLLDAAALYDALGEARLGLLRDQAREARLPSVYSLLSYEPPYKRYYASHMVDVNEQMESSPLGWRKALARGTSRQKLDRLLYDKHPMVVEILLNNPRILERDVIKMAALQPTTEHALRTIFVHPRWIRRYSVKKALVFNPYTPISLVENLLGFLLHQDLQDASRSRRLSPQVRARAQRMLDEQARLKRPRLLQVVGEDESHGPASTATESVSLAYDFLSELEQEREDVEDSLRLLEAEGVEARSVSLSGLAETMQGDEAFVLEDAEDFLNSLPENLTLEPVSEDDDS